MSERRWLRISYRVGALADALCAVVMLVPGWLGAIYEVAPFEPGRDFRYAMALGASLMIRWTMLLLWADRRPVERRGVLPITIVVILGLASAGAYAVASGLIALGEMIPTWAAQAFLVALLGYSYARSRSARTTSTVACS